MIVTRPYFRRLYPDKKRCYECGEDGHLSYKCTKNVLGEREPPPKKQRKSKSEKDREAFEYWNDDIGSEDAVCFYIGDGIDYSTN